jgi:hypothetical protein
MLAAFDSWREAGDYRFPPAPEVDAAAVDRARERHLVFEGWITIFG